MSSADESGTDGTGPDQLGRRAAALLHEPPAHVPLERRVPRQATSSDTEVLPRAAAVATARAAVRQGRARQALRAAARAADSGTVTPSRAAPRGPDPSVRGDTVGEEPEHSESARREDSSTERRRAGPRFALALRERLPLWLQLRCGVEPRTLLAVAVVLLAAIAFAVHHFWTGRPEAVRAPQARPAPAVTAEESAEAGGTPGKSAATQGPPGKRLVVDVAGKVRKPGVYRLPDGARVADALKSAGGVRPGTDLTGLNRARRLIDGEQVVAGGAAAPGSAAGKPSDAGTGAGAASGAGAGAGGAPGGTVSLNSATAEQLETLPGVGPVLAQHILDFRDENGGFTSVDQLHDVNGIGERRFADIEPKVSP